MILQLIDVSLVDIPDSILNYRWSREQLVLEIPVPFMTPIRVIKNGDRFTLVTGVRRLEACKKQGVNEWQAWVFDTEKEERIDHLLAIEEARRSGSEFLKLLDY